MYLLPSCVDAQEVLAWWEVWWGWVYSYRLICGENAVENSSACHVKQSDRDRGIDGSEVVDLHRSPGWIG